ncbi:C-1-tetrahydrofolate synthase [Gracilaria domingensis]|nr:C-1-tetrahydrofolate synthase [Gracilaria domingensis]
MGGGGGGETRYNGDKAGESVGAEQRRRSGEGGGAARGLGWGWGSPRVGLRCTAAAAGGGGAAAAAAAAAAKVQFGGQRAPWARAQAAERASPAPCSGAATTRRGRVVARARVTTQKRRIRGHTQMQRTRAARGRAGAIF